jgi:hypothetical protein
MFSIIIFSLFLWVCGGQVAVEARSLGVAVSRLRPGEELCYAGLAHKAMGLKEGVIASSGHR